MNRAKKTYLCKLFLIISIIPVPLISYAASDGFSIEEITVTARKREENLQEIPISVAAFTANELEFRQIQSTDQLTDIIPNLVFESSAPNSGSNSASTIFIRGIGQTDFSQVTDPGVGVYIDGVYYARSRGLVLDFLDIERIEVLRGPQGTLFGRNTIGGAVVIQSRKPGDEFQGKLRLEIGSDSKNFWTASMDVPLSDTIKSSLALNRRVRDGYVIRTFDGVDTGNDDTWSGRASVVWNPTENFEAYFIGDFTRIRENGGPQVSGGVNELGIMARAVNLADPLCPTNSLAPVTTNNNPDCANLTANIGQYLSGSTLPTFSNLDAWGTSASLTWDVADWVSVKSLTVFRSSDTEAQRDPDGTRFIIFHTLDILEHEQFSQELQFTGNALDGDMDWLAGLYYFREEGDNSNPVELPLGNLHSGGSTDNDSNAIFAQATYHATDRVSLTLGVRYTEDTKRFTPNQFYTSESVLVAFGIVPPGFALTPIGPLPVGSLILPNQEFASEFSDTNYHANLAYQWNDNIMTYISYSTGFKTGGWDQRFVAPPIDSNGNATNAPTSFRPEFASTFEVGIKSDLFDNQLRVNAAVFRTDYDDLQIIIRETFNPVTFNGGEADIWGFEIESVIVPSPNLIIDAAVGYLDAGYDKLDASVTTNRTPLSLDNSLVNAPEWSLSAGVAYNFPLSNEGTITPRIDWSYHDEQETDAINSTGVHQDSYHLLNASVRFESGDGRWVGTLAGRNILDETYLVSGSSAFNAGSSYLELIYNRPAEWSLTVEYSFF